MDFADKHKLKIARSTLTNSWLGAKILGVSKQQAWDTILKLGSNADLNRAQEDVQECLAKEKLTDNEKDLCLQYSIKLHDKKVGVQW